MPDRMQRVNTLLQRELSSILERAIEFPAGCFVTVKHVKTARDLRHAAVWISVLPIAKRDSILATLAEKRGEIQRHLGERVRLRYVPKLEFKLDTQEERAEQLNSLIDSVSKGRSDK